MLAGSLRRYDLQRVSERKTVHKLTVFGVHIDVAMKVQAPSVHITGDAVAGLNQGRSNNCALGQLEPFRVEQMIDPVPKVEKVYRHRALPIAWAEHAGTDSYQRTKLRLDGMNKTERPAEIVLTYDSAAKCTYVGGKPSKELC